MPNFSSPVFLSSNVVDSFFTVIKSIAADNIFWPDTAFFFLLFGKRWLVEKVDVLCLNREVNLIGLRLLVKENFKLKPFFRGNQLSDMVFQVVLYIVWVLITDCPLCRIVSRMSGKLWVTQ